MHLIFLLLTIEFTFDIIDTRRSQKREQRLKGLKIYDFWRIPETKTS